LALVKEIGGLAANANGTFSVAGTISDICNSQLNNPFLEGGSEWSHL